MKGFMVVRKCGCRALRDAVLMVVVIGSILLYAGCSSTTVAFRQGVKAEQQHDYDAAVVDFQKALQSQPDNSRYLLYEKDARTEDSILHLKRGRALLAQNQTDAAAAEFQTAVGVDPSNEAAAQELRQILIKKAAEKARREQIIHGTMEQNQQPDTSGAVQLHALSPTIIPVLHISGNSREVFRALGKIAGLNVVFYHDFENRPISLDLESVTIEQALEAAEAEAGVFWKAITPNTILLIPDTPINRERLESDVLKTVYLQNPTQAQDRMAILTAVKQVVGLTKSFVDPNANALILYGTPEQVQAADHLIQSLDRGKAEILIDVSVVEADKNYMRDLGLEPVPITGNTIAAIGFNPPTSTSTTSSSTGTASTTPYLSLNQLGKIGTGDFAAVLSGVEANAILSNEITHILQSPQVRVMAGQQAILKIGEEYPYATGSFGLPATSVVSSSTSTSSLLSETQFQYKDIGVDVTVTPDVAANGDIILKSKVEISAFGGDEDIGGVEEPLFTDRSDEAMFRLTEGETSLLGGLIESQIENTTTGLPGLADIPVLKYFFSDNNKTVTDQEVLIMMTPHIIRLPERLSAAAEKEIAAPASQTPGMPTYGGGFRGGRP
jgi:general secretion pathway protein D